MVQFEVAVVNASKAKLGANVTHLNAWRRGGGEEGEGGRSKGRREREAGKMQNECNTIT